MKKPAPKKVIVHNPVFVYISTCCNVQATKPACAMQDGVRVGRFGDVPKGETQAGIGHGFRCGKCSRPCKVSRHKREKAADANA